MGEITGYDWLSLLGMLPGRAGQVLGGIFHQAAEQERAAPERKRIRDIHQMQLENLIKAREEEERLASLPLFTQKEIPTGGIGTVEGGEIPQYDIPTGIRKEVGVEQVPIPGYKMKDIGKVDLGV